MADPDIESRVIEVDELLLRPGTYFNPQTEIVVIVDDSTSIDQEIFNLEAYEGSDWVRVSDDVPVDEEGRDRALEGFETRNQPGAIAADALETNDDDLEEDEERPEPDPDAAEE